MPRASSHAARGLVPAALGRLVASLPALLLVTDADGRIRFNSGTLGVAGGRRTAAELIGHRITDFVDDAERDQVNELLRAVGASEPGTIVGPVRAAYRDVDGILRTTEAWGVNQTEDRELDGFVLLLLPETAYDRFDQILMQVVGDASLVSTFGALVQALRYPPVGGESYFLMPDDDNRGLTRAPDLAEVPGPPGPGPWDAVLSHGEVHAFAAVTEMPAGLAEQALRAGFGSVSCYRVQPQADGRPGSCLVVWSPSLAPPPLNVMAATERAAVIASLAISHRSVAERLRDAAYQDALTGLDNRRRFFELLEEQIEAGEQPAVLYIDLDNFKAVNDSLGHLAGDAVLRVAARRLASVMRPTDELARLGGDEFAVLCRGGVSVDQMTGIAERVVDQLNQPVSVGDAHSVDVGASVGIALGLPVGTSANAILAHADRALYEAKSKGRGRHAFADPRQEVAT